MQVVQRTGAVRDEGGPAVNRLDRLADLSDPFFNWLEIYHASTYLPIHYFKWIGPAIRAGHGAHTRDRHTRSILLEMGFAVGLGGVITEAQMEISYRIGSHMLTELCISLERWIIGNCI